MNDDAADRTSIDVAREPWVVVATKGSSGVRVLEQPDLGAVSQVADLADAHDEMVEAIAHLSGQRTDQVDIEVRRS